MGHVRLGRLPATRKWNDVVALLGEGAPVGDIAGASADAPEASLSAARDDPALLHAFWLLTQLTLAARSGDFEQSLIRPDAGTKLLPTGFVADRRFGFARRL